MDSCRPSWYNSPETNKEEEVMITTLVGVTTGLMFGLYAGKKRAVGLGWPRIVCDLTSDMTAAAKSAWGKLSGPFRKGESGNAPET